MRKRKRLTPETRRRLETAVIWLLPIAVWVLALVLMCSCTTTRYVPVVTSRDSVRVVSHHDTLLSRDSVYCDRYVHGDTVYVTRDRYRTVYKTVYKTDSMTLVRRDTVTLEKRVEGKKITTPWWRRCGVIATLAAVVALLYAIRKRFS